MRRRQLVEGLIALLFTASTASPQTIYLGAGVRGSKMPWLLIATVFILAYGWGTDEVTLYKAEGRWDEALSLWVQDFFIGWIENLEMKAGLLYGFPAFPFPDPFRDPEKAIESFANFVRKMQKEGMRFPPLIFVRGWPIRARWKGNSPDDALVSLNDFAYALGQDQWRDIIRHDWKTWRFTLSLQDKTLTFSAGSQKGIVSGKEVQLRYPVERSFYDLYVPLGDLVRLVGGSLRPPKPDELEVFRRHLPVSLLVLELQR